MTSAFDQFMALLKINEGGLDLNPADRGNWTSGVVGKGELRGTYLGISAAAFPTLDIQHLTDAQVQMIYDTNYLHPIAFYDLPLPIALLVADGAVNQGLSAASRDLQAAIGASVDGVVGPLTVATAKAASDGQAVADEITARRALRYAQTSTIATFGLGWFRRLVRTRRSALPMAA